MKWLSTMTAMLAIGMAGILPVNCMMPVAGSFSGAVAISKACSCCESSGSVCCMQTAKTTPSEQSPSVLLPANNDGVGMLPASTVCIGEIVSWAPADYRPLARGQLLPNARLTYQRIQVFLI